MNSSRVDHLFFLYFFLLFIYSFFFHKNVCLYRLFLYGHVYSNT